MVTLAHALLLHPLQTAHLTAHTKLMNTVTILNIQKQYVTTTVSYCQHCMGMEEKEKEKVREKEKMSRRRRSTLYLEHYKKRRIELYTLVSINHVCL